MKGLKMAYRYGNRKQAVLFLLRGLNGAKAEMSLSASCFNIAGVATICGVNSLMAKLC
jgi:hypothetical protein